MLSDCSCPIFPHDAQIRFLSRRQINFDDPNEKLLGLGDLSKALVSCMILEKQEEM